MIYIYTRTHATHTILLFNIAGVDDEYIFVTSFNVMDGLNSLLTICF